MGLTISSIGCRDLRLARLLGCVVAESDAQVFDRPLSSDAEEWIPLPTSGQWAEQIDGALPAVRLTPNNQWRR